MKRRSFLNLLGGVALLVPSALAAGLAGFQRRAIKPGRYVPVEACPRCGVGLLPGWVCTCGSPWNLDGEIYGRGYFVSGPELEVGDRVNVTMDRRREVWRIEAKVDARTALARRWAAEDARRIDQLIIDGLEAYKR